MRNKHSISSIVLIIAAVTLLTAFTALLSACQMATPNAASPEEAVQEAAQPRQPTVTRTLSTRTVPPSPNSAVPPAISTPAEPSSTSVSWYAMSIAIPVDIQDFVDRTDAIVIGTVASVEGPVDDLPYNVDSEFVKMHLEDPYPLPSITVTYYAIELEEIVLDDGNISGNAFIRVPGTPDSFKLQVGDRLLFGLSPNPDFRSYAPDVPWGLVFLDGRGLRYFNENPLSYEGVTDEASLVAAIESALPARVTTPRNIRWNPLAGEGQWDGAVGRQSIWDSRGNSTMTVYYPPLDAQDFVNRADAIVVGSISEIGDIFVLGWEDPEPNVLEKLAEAGVRPLGLAVTDYTIAVERVLLDDGDILQEVSFRLLGIHSPRRPQVGERFVFSLKVDDELRSYGVCCDWDLVFLDDGPLRYFDDGALTFEGVTDGPSLIVALESALANRLKACPKEWPKRPGFESWGRDC